MIGVIEAIEKVKNSSIILDIIKVELIDALNHCLSEDVYSKMDMPPFSQSAMDGYAICGSGNTFEVIGEVKAGDTELFTLQDGQAFRIFTGAMIPTGTTSIAKQEIVDRLENKIILQEDVKTGTSIRKQGEEILTGNLVMKKGTVITPAAIGLLSGLGISIVNVIKRPIITLVVTGN